MFHRLPGATGSEINITINGEPASAYANDSVAAAVLCHGMQSTRTSTVSGSPRAPLCMMGVCFECLMIIDGKPNQRACMVKVREGMTVEFQRGVGEAV